MFNIIKIGYNPDISEETKTWIRGYITPSMFSDDNSSHQYHLDTIKCAIDDGYYVLSDEDATVFQEAYNQNVEYFEF